MLSSVSRACPQEKSEIALPNDIDLKLGCNSVQFQTYFTVEWLIISLIIRGLFQIIMNIIRGLSI